MKRLIFTVAIAALTAGDARAQSSVPAAGLAAEGESRWTEALQIYRDEAARTASPGELWLRIADIEARLGRPHAAILALHSAAEALPGDAAVFAKLSRAYAANGYATAALRAIEGALRLQPDDDGYLRARATLATWAGEYAAAADTYRTLRSLHPQEPALTLALARVSVWSGASDAAADAYRAYLETPDAERDAWIELARTESWRGNFAAALRVLREYERRFGQTASYSRERVAILARGGRPRQALREMQPLLWHSPEDFDLNLSRTIALAAVQKRGAALSSLTGVDALRPGDADARAAEGLVRSLLGSTAGPTSSFYSDSDGLRLFKVAPRADLGFRTDTHLLGGYEHIELQARTGSGLEQASGASSATVEHAWAGLSQRIGPLTLGATIGQARPEAHRLTTYSAFIRVVPADTLVVSVERSYGFAAISPRTAGLGLTRTSHRVQLDWAAALRYHLALDGSYEDLSDGNSRWEIFASPRAVVARTQRFNLDAGLLVHQFGAASDFDNGYYDPHRYEYYSVVLSPYWKAADNIGVAISAGFGIQRDDARRKFRPGSNASAEATFGIYEPWVLKIYGSTTNNRRLDSGAFSGVSGGIALLRRF